MTTDGEDPVAAVRRTLDDFGNAVSRGDYDAVLDLITDDAVFWPANAPAIQGKEAVRAGYDALAGYRIHAEFEPEEIRVCGDWAFARGYESFTAEPKAGGPKIEIRRRRAISILTLENGRWRAARGMTNYAAPIENPRPAGS